MPWIIFQGLSTVHAYNNNNVYRPYHPRCDNRLTRRRKRILEREKDQEKYTEPLKPWLQGGNEVGKHVWSRLLRRLGGRRLNGWNNIDLGRETPTPAIPTFKFAFHSVIAHFFLRLTSISTSYPDSEYHMVLSSAIRPFHDLFRVGRCDLFKFWHPVTSAVRL